MVDHEHAYVARALELLRAREQHRQIGAAIANRCNLLFADPDPARAFADLLEQLGATATP